MYEPKLTVNDHWCCHIKCPYIGTGKSCVECRRLALNHGKASNSNGMTSKEAVCTKN